MKKLVLPLLFLYFGLSYAQVKIGDDINTIDAASVLELQSSTKTLVLTRVTNAEMLAIRPLHGALIYNTDTQCVHYFDGTNWFNLCEAAMDNFSGSFLDLTNIPADLDTDSTDDFDGEWTSLLNVPANLDLDSTDDFSGSFLDLTNVPANLDTDSTDDFDGEWTSLLNIPANLDLDSTDDFSGSFLDLTNVPANLDTDSTDDFSGSFLDLTNVPANLDTDSTDDFDGEWTGLLNIPANLDLDSTDDFSGSYNDLTDVPTGITVTGTAGSLFFADTDGSPTDNNSQLFWDTTNNRLGIGTTSPTHKLQVSGQVRATSFANADGTVGSPAYRFNSDGDTGMYRAAANQLGFSTGGTDAIRIDASQNVGVNIDTPTERLDVNGTARIRDISTTSSDLDVLVTTATGVIQKRPFADFGGAAGTSVTGASINASNELIITLSDASTINAGSLGNPKINFGGRWTNTDITTDLNVDNTVVPIFGTEDYKDDANNLYEVSGNTLIVKEAGRYEIRANISLLGLNTTGTSEEMTNVVARLAVNGSVEGAFAATGFIRFDNNHDHSSIHVNEILDLNANDVVSILSFLEANFGVVRFSGAGESSFSINKLR